MKTFWDWHDKQLPDGTVIWTMPSGHTYVTTPGSALLFPTLCAPTGDLPTPDPAGGADRCCDRTAMMPLRTTTRAQNRAHRIAAERHHNRQSRLAAQRVQTGLAPAVTANDQPPPF